MSFFSFQLVVSLRQDLPFTFLNLVLVPQDFFETESEAFQNFLYKIIFDSPERDSSKGVDSSIPCFKNSFKGSIFSSA